MRVLVLTQGYPPEPTKLLSDRAETLQTMGNKVTVLTGFPNWFSGKLYAGYRLRLWQREEQNGIQIIRVPLFPDHSRSALKRALNFLSIELSATVLGHPDQDLRVLRRNLKRPLFLLTFVSGAKGDCAPLGDYHGLPDRQCFRAFQRVFLHDHEPTGQHRASKTSSRPFPKRFGLRRERAAPLAFLRGGFSDDRWRHSHDGTRGRDFPMPSTAYGRYWAYVGTLLSGSPGSRMTVHPLFAALSSPRGRESETATGRLPTGNAKTPPIGHLFGFLLRAKKC